MHKHTRGAATSTSARGLTRLRGQRGDQAALPRTRGLRQPHLRPRTTSRTPCPSNITKPALRVRQNPANIRSMATKKTTTRPRKKAKATKAKVSKKRATKAKGLKSKTKLPPKATKAVKQAADALWGMGVPPHTLLKELYEVLLLRCLDEADGNYAAAAALFGPSRQSVQQYANSPLRDARWKAYRSE